MTLNGKVALVTGASRGLGAAVAPGGVATDFALEPGRGRPRNHRILETAFRPMTEASWG